ncbi:MAG: class I SAM-dependent methyltransferase [Rickettsiales bacterium]|nr:class I SAM-dependent methyltransferase [Rickettsiales bacterium]
MGHNSITIIPLNKTDYYTAQNLAQQLKLPIKDSSCDYALKIDGDDLFITPNDRKVSKLSPLRVDFISSKNKYRFRNISRKNELIAKAVGLKSNISPHVIDATAGLGTDSFILAYLGCHVTMCERSPIIQVLLENALEKSINIPEISETIKRMRLIKDDFIHYITESDSKELDNSDVIYLDPMFPERSKSAAVKKDMQYMQNLLDEPIELEPMLEQALKSATYRVVVKRPKNAPTVSSKTFSYAVSGKAVRFDVYINKAYPDSLERVDASKFDSHL